MKRVRCLSSMKPYCTDLSATYASIRHIFRQQAAVSTFARPKSWARRANATGNRLTSFECTVASASVHRGAVSMRTIAQSRHGFEAGIRPLQGPSTTRRSLVTSFSFWVIFGGWRRRYERAYGHMPCVTRTRGARSGDPRAPRVCCELLPAISIFVTARRQHVLNAVVMH